MKFHLAVRASVYRQVFYCVTNRVIAQLNVLLCCVSVETYPLVYNQQGDSRVEYITLLCLCQ